MSINNDYSEVDAAWFSPQWLLDHPDFPLASSIVTADGSVAH